MQVDLIVYVMSEKKIYLSSEKSVPDSSFDIDNKHGVHGVSCAAHVFAQKQHVRRTVVRTFTIPPPHCTPSHPTPPHPRFSAPELLQ